MNLDEILREIDKLSPEERQILQRELERPLSKPEAQSATPETVSAVHHEQQASGDERGLPLEDVIRDPKDLA